MLPLSQIRTLAGCHLFFVFLVVMLLAPETLSAALAASTTASLDAGGKRVTSSRYTIDGSVGSLGGISTATAPSVMVRDGYAGQLYELQSIIISASLTNVIETGTSQLTVIGVLNDGTFLSISPTNAIWSVVSGPLISITANGKAISTNVYQNTAATVSAAYQGVSATLTFTVSPFSILSLSKADGFAVYFPALTNQTYNLFYASNLTSGKWSQVPSQISLRGGGGLKGLLDASPLVAQRFYRVASGVSNLRITSGARFSGWSVSYASSSNCLYSLYYSTNLAFGVWTPVSSQTNIPGSGGVDSLMDTDTGSPQRFYRIGVVVP